MSWIVFAVLGGFFQAVFVEINRVFKIDSWQLNFLHAFFAIIVMLPLIPWMVWPVQKEIFLAALVSAAVITIGCQMQIYMSSQHNGRVASMYRPVSIFCSFVVWMVLVPQSTIAYLENHWLLLGVLLAFTLNVFALVVIRKNDIGWRAFLLMAPIGVIYSLSNVVCAYVLQGESVFSTSLTLAFLIYCFMLVLSFSGVVAKKRLTRNLLSPHMLKVGFLIGLFSAVAYVFNLMSLSTTPNPAFTSILGTLVPVWIMIYHKIIGLKDDASPIAGTIMVLGAVVLIWVTSFV